MDIDIYRVVANTHMADGLMVYVPRERLLVQETSSTSTGRSTGGAAATWTT